MDRSWLVFPTLFLFFAASSCKQSKERELIIDPETKVVGNIRNDSTYDGLMKFYSLPDGRLLTAANYRDGEMHGERTDYYSNGKPGISSSYICGRQHGYGVFFDSTGKVSRKQYFYFGLRSGPSVNWENGELVSYSFYSLDNTELFFLDYAELRTRLITEVQDGFFFYSLSQYSVTTQNKPEDHMTDELLLYLPQPPRFRFQYSVVTIDTAYKVLSTIAPKEKNEILAWYEKPATNAGVVAAIKLVIEDSIKGGTHTMFKKL